MWHGRRRIKRLEQDIAEARVAQAALQQRLEIFEKIAAAAGASLDAVAAPGITAAGGPASAPVPATLLAAAGQRHEHGTPVRLAVGDSDVIAVIGDEGGTPDEWWTAIHKITSRLRSVS